MSTLFFDVMSRLDEDPDWSAYTKSNRLSERKLAEIYERKLGIGKKPKEHRKYSWLKPPENWNNSEANEWNLT